MNELTQCVSWVVLSLLGDDVGEQRMNDAVAEAVGLIVAAENGDEEAMKRVHNAAGAFAATVKARRELADRVAAERKRKMN